MREQTEQLQAVFIRHARMIRGEPPMWTKLLTFIQAERYVGVAYINREKHPISLSDHDL